MTLAAKIEALAADETTDPRRHFADPQVVVDARDAPYLARLNLLQRWRAAASDGAAALGEVDAALKSLQVGAGTWQDAPEEAPGAWGYGKQKP